MKLRLFLLGCGLLLSLASRSLAEEPGAPRRDYSIPVLDLSALSEYHTVVAKDLDSPNQYLGHPSTVLLDDGHSILSAFPTAHGHGKLRMRLSRDGGLSWKNAYSLDTDLHEVPTLFKVERPDGKTRIVLATCVPKSGEFRSMVSDDQGASWSKMEHHDLGLKRGIIVALASLWAVRDEEDKAISTWRGVFHDYGFDNYTIDLKFRRDPDAYGGWATVWEKMRKIEFETPEGLSRSRAAQLCEAGVVRSPKGDEIALLFRPQAKKTNAMISVSRDDGVSWSDPRELSGSLSGERHVARYSPDGRLLVCFRDFSPHNPKNPTHADWVAWVGTWDDLVNAREGQYRVRLKDNYGNSTNGGVGDCGYSGIELLDDGTFVCTSYGHWELADGQKPPNGSGRSPFILATRFKLSQLDALVKAKQHLIAR